MDLKNILGILIPHANYFPIIYRIVLYAIYS